jgi:hypothetical protein
MVSDLVDVVAHSGHRKKLIEYRLAANVAHGRPPKKRPALYSYSIRQMNYSVHAII